jgi:DNA polymerase-3 subunit beta
MDLKLNRNTVLSELSLLQGVVERRTTIPILTSILAQAASDRLEMVATDLDMTVMTSCAAEVVDDGKITLASRVFQDLVRNLPEEQFRLAQDGDAVEISSGRFASRMAVMDPSDFPTLPEPPESTGYSLPLDVLQLVFERVAFAITKDDPKFQLNGALVKLLPGEIEVAATDGHRLAVVRAKAPDTPPPFEQQLFPRKLLGEFSRFEDDEVLLSATPNHLGFRVGHRTLVSRVVELRFPQYERVIVRDNPYHARVDRQELLGSLRRVSLMAHEKARGVRFVFSSDGELILSSIGHELGSAEETLSMTYQGETVEISLNAMYLTDVLSVLTCPSVELQLKDGASQCLLVPVDDDPRLEEYLYVIMPMRV